MGWPIPDSVREAFRGFQAMREVGRQVSAGTQAFLGSFGDSLPDINIDDIVTAKGISIYREMQRRDESVDAALSFKRAARLASPGDLAGGEIQSYDDQDENANNQAEYVRFALENIMQGTFASMIDDLMDAFGMGFSTVEVIPTIYTDGPWRGFRGVQRFHKPDQEYLELKSDEFGQIRDDGIWQQVPLTNLVQGATKTENGLYLQHDKSRFVIYSHRKLGDHHYGRSDCRTMYRWWFIKDFVVRRWGQYLQHYGLPFLTAEQGSVSAVGGGATDRTNLLTILKQLGETRRAVLPPGTKINMQMPTFGASARANFKELIQACDKAMMRAALIPDLVFGSADGNVGSYALGKERGDQFVLQLNAIGQALEDVINEQLIVPHLIRPNFANPLPPKFVFSPYTREDRKELAEIVTAAVELGEEIPKGWLRERIGAPEVEEGQEALKKSGGGLPPMIESGLKGNGNGNEPPQPPNAIDQAVDSMEKRGLTVQGFETTADGGVRVFARKSGQFWREPFDTELKVDFATLDETEENAEIETSENVGILLGSVRDRVVDGVKKNGGQPQRR